MAAAVQDSKDGVTWTGALTADVIKFTLLGGKYMMAVSAASTSSELDVLMPDGSTYQAVGTSTTFTTLAATAVVDLPPGSYRVVFVATSGVQGFLVKVPYRPIG